MRQSLILLTVAFLFVGLLAYRMWSYATTVTERYEHPSGLHAGNLVSLGNDRYHAEVVFTRDGLLKLYVLDRSGSRAVEADARTLSAFVTADGEQASHVVELRPEPQIGDASGKTSCFVGTLPKNLAGQASRVTMPNLSVGGERFHLTYAGHSAEHVDMPTPVAQAEGRVLYLTAAGLYTDADIEANGRTTPSQKYRNFQAKHDFTPQAGDPLCPITRTKADPSCTWIVAGETYRFCCPPCIDEFVRLAKEEPEKLRSPSDYVKP